MAIHAPGRRPAFPPIGRLRASPIHGGPRSGLISLNLTPMVDMMTMLVVFLLQSFSADGQIMFVQKDLVMPPADASKPLIDRGPVVTVYDERVFVEAKRAIEPGEELTYDYNLIVEERYTPALKRMYACACGSRKCRGHILGSKR